MNRVYSEQAVNELLGIGDNYQAVGYDSFDAAFAATSAGEADFILVSQSSDAVVAVIIVRIVLISSFFFYCLLLNHSFSTNPNRIILTALKLILFLFTTLPTTFAQCVRLFLIY